MSHKMEDLVRYYSDKGPVVLLESQSSDHPESRVSYLAARPKSSITAFGDRITIREGRDNKEFNANPWQALSDYYASRPRWLFGYLGYDLKNHIEALHSQNPDLIQAPDLYFMEPEVLIKFSWDGNSYEFLRGNPPKELQEFSGIEGSDTFNCNCGPLNFSMQREDYLGTIREAQRRIREGDFYEINLSHQLYSECTGSSYDLYRQMKEIGPVPFGAFLKTGELSICSLSPERFLKKEGSRVISQPIKGTTARGETAEEDQKLRRALEASLKDRAENLMIVDLVRNDLGRIARRGSVKVSKLFEIQTFGTVHQMVSTIEAESIVEDPVEIIKACYPMGSMTGAPKISAMKSIEELEAYKRGIYSGAIGYLDPQGDFDFNVVIRTAIISGNRLFYSVGGAITGDSVPEAEWEETMIKARALTKLPAVSS